jgi:hypothetical protein
MVHLKRVFTSNACPYVLDIGLLSALLLFYPISHQLSWSSFISYNDFLGNWEKKKFFARLDREQGFFLPTFAKCQIIQESILPNFVFLCFLFLLSLAILKHRQYLCMLQTLKLNNEKQKKIFVLQRKKFGKKHSQFMSR